MTEANTTEANLAGRMWPRAGDTPEGENPAGYVGYVGLRYRQPEDPDKTPHLDTPSWKNKAAVTMHLCTRSQAPVMSAGMALPLVNMLHMTPSSVTARPGGLQVGDKGPAFTVLDLKGGKVSSDSFLGKPLVLMVARVLGKELFCPYSIPLTVQMKDYWRAFEARGVQVAMIFPTSLERTRDFVETVGIEYPAFADPDWSVSNHYPRFLGMLPLQADAILDEAGVIRFLWKSDGGPGGDSLPPMATGLLKEVDRLFPDRAPKA